eukprot:3291901-Amphidinium_carterae.1
MSSSELLPSQLIVKLKLHLNCNEVEDRPGANDLAITPLSFYSPSQNDLIPMLGEESIIITPLCLSLRLHAVLEQKRHSVGCGRCSLVQVLGPRAWITSVHALALYPTSYSVMSAEEDATPELKIVEATSLIEESSTYHPTVFDYRP